MPDAQLCRTAQLVFRSLLPDVPHMQPRGFGRVVGRLLRMAMGEIRFTRGPLVTSIPVQRACLFVVLGRVREVLRSFPVMFRGVV